MPVDTVVPAVQTILSGITGVTRAFDQLPGSLNKADLPAFLILPQATEQLSLTRQGYKEERRYLLLLYVAPFGVDSFSYGYNTARVFFRRVQDAFAAAHRLNSLAGVLNAEIEGDSGIVPLIYGQSQYAGIEFRLRVIETYASTVDV